MHELIANRMRTVKPSFVREVLKVAGNKDIISFAGGLPAPELFDVEGLRAAAMQAFEADPVGALQYGQTEGYAALREQIALLMQGRGVPCDADDLVVSVGSQQGIDLMARTLIDPGDVVLLEQPSYLAALQVFELAQASMVGVEADEHGLLPDALERHVIALKAEGRKPKMLYLVATFANPTGATLSVERRRRILEIAVEHDFLIVEDDPYSELRYHGEPVTPMVGLAREMEGGREHIAYLSTFSKILAPGLRCGWMVLPQWLHRQVVIVKQASDLHASTLAQHTAFHYLSSGRMSAHVPRIREAYGEKARALMTALERHMPGAISFNRPDGGMFLWARFAPGVDTMNLVERAIEEKVIFVPGAVFYARDPRQNELRLSYATATPDMIEEGVRRLARLVMD